MSLLGEAKTAKLSGVAASGSSLSKSPLLRSEDFHIVEKIGRGSWGEVTKCKYVTIRDPTQQYYAVKKTLPAEMTDGHLPIPVELQNLEILYTLGRHENIIDYYGYFVDSGDEYIHFVFEYADGGNLGSWLYEKGSFSESETATLTCGILGGLDFLHSHGFVHRDMKPENVVVKNRETLQVKLIDFASARQANKDITRALAIRHTAPESIASRGSPTIYNQASEIFVAGIIVYQLLTGDHPFDRRRDTWLCFFKNGPRRALCRRRIRLYQLNTDNRAFQAISEPGRSFVLRLLAYSPSSRPSAQDALNDTWLKRLKR